MENGSKPAYGMTEEESDRLDAGINIYYGLTKREYFAGQALMGLCAGRTKYEDPMIDVSKAVVLADMLLKELDKKTIE